MNLVRTCSAPGKLMLLGEYAALGGGAVLVAAVGRRARCTVTPGEGVRVEAPGLTAGALTLGAPCDDATFKYAEALLASWPAPTAGRYVLESEAFAQGGRKLGLGSSAASTTALAAALLVESGGRLDATGRAMVYAAAHAAHRKAQGGHGSGFDVAAATWGGLLGYRWFEAGTPPPGKAIRVGDGSGAPEPLPAWPGLRLLTVFTGVSADTRAMMAQVRAWAAADAVRARNLLTGLSEAASVGIEAVRTRDKHVLVAAADAGLFAVEALTRESGAPIVTDVHREVARLVAPFEAVAKPTGAGGGDLAWVVGPDDAAEEAAARALEAAGLPVLWLEVDPEGARVDAR